MIKLIGENNEYEFPDELYYSKNRVWMRLKDDGNVVVGLTDFTTKLSGPLTYVRVDDEEPTEQNENMGMLESQKWSGELIAPISGDVLDVNPEIEDYPAIINESPYEAGWIVIIKPSNLDGEVDNLMKGDSQEFRTWQAAEIKNKENELSPTDFTIGCC